jgi:hypothetical protein
MLIEGLAIAALVGAGTYLLSSRRVGQRSTLVLYTGEGSNVQEFRTNADNAAGLLRTRAVPVVDGQSLLNAVRAAPRNLGLVLMIGHGSGSSFFRPGTAGLRIGRDALPTWLGDDSFTCELAPKLGRNFVLSLAGCRAGAEQNEPDWTSEAYWTGSTPGPGGAHSLAGEIRDALVRAGVREGEVRAHSTTGGVFANPGGRVFAVEAPFVGRPGAALMDLVMGPGSSRDRTKISRWNGQVRGTLAVRWILGGRMPTRAEAEA